MPEKICAEIKDGYDFYTKLLQERKFIFENVVEIRNVCSNQANYLENTATLKHETVVDENILIVQVRIENYKYFHFKLKCSKLSATPFFRYDSDGPTHRNKDDNIPMSEQWITTPHFHKHTKEGKEIAYKTSKLLEVSEEKALQDIGLCIAHFCDESNIRLNQEDYPDIKITYGLGIRTDEYDPLNNLKFQ